MAHKICLLSPQEADDVKEGRPVNCRNHRHAGSRKVRELRFDSYRGNVAPVILPNGNMSVNQMMWREEQSREWRNIDAGMQLVPTNLPKRRQARRHKSKFPQPPGAHNGPVFSSLDSARQRMQANG